MLRVLIYKIEQRMKGKIYTDCLKHFFSFDQQPVVNNADNLTNEIIKGIQMKLRCIEDDKDLLSYLRIRILEKSNDESFIDYSPFFAVLVSILIAVLSILSALTENLSFLIIFVYVLFVFILTSGTSFILHKGKTNIKKSFFDISLYIIDNYDFEINRFKKK